MAIPLDCKKALKCQERKEQLALITESRDFWKRKYTELEIRHKLLKSELEHMNEVTAGEDL
jgi:hypothetical protein